MGTRRPLADGDQPGRHTELPFRPAQTPTRGDHDPSRSALGDVPPPSPLATVKGARTSAAPWAAGGTSLRSRSDRRVVVAACLSARRCGGELWCCGHAAHASSFDWATHCSGNGHPSAFGRRRPTGTTRPASNPPRSPPTPMFRRNIGCPSRRRWAPDTTASARSRRPLADGDQPGRHTQLRLQPDSHPRGSNFAATRRSPYPQVRGANAPRTSVRAPQRGRAFRRRSEKRRTAQPDSHPRGSNFAATRRSPYPQVRGANAPRTSVRAPRRGRADGSPA